MTALHTRILTENDAYAQALRRGAPRQPDQCYAETLLSNTKTEVLGVFNVKEKLIGFAVFFDLPQTIDGRRLEQLDSF